MKKFIKKLYLIFKLFGFDVKVFLTTIKGIFFYFRDFQKIKKQKSQDKTFIFGKCWPILNERFLSSGTASGHYFHQDLLVARKIFTNQPKKHLDIGSRIDGFVAHVAVFRKIDVVDIRDLNISIKNINFTRMDLMNLPENFVNSYDSISSLHVIEHFGLGRYNDPIDYFGYLKALKTFIEFFNQEENFIFQYLLVDKEFNLMHIGCLRSDI